MSRFLRSVSSPHRLAVLMLVMSLGAVAPLRADTVVLTPTQDAWLDGRNPSRNNGAANLLSVEGDTNRLKRAVLQFDLSGVSGTVTSATLTMERIGGQSGSDTLTVYALTETWQEGAFDNATCSASGVTWTSRNCTAPNNWTTAGGTTNGTVYASTALTSNFIGAVNWNVTSLAQAWVAGSVANRGLLVRRNTESNSTLPRHDFDSREGNTAPTLTVVFTPPAATSTTTATATRTATNTATPTSTATGTATFTATATATGTATNTATPTATLTATPTNTATGTATFTATATVT